VLKVLRVPEVLPVLVPKVLPVLVPEVLPVLVPKVPEVLRVPADLRARRRPATFPDSLGVTGHL
jgi:hypothetical protein